MFKFRFIILLLLLFKLFEIFPEKIFVKLLWDKKLCCNVVSVVFCPFNFIKFGKADKIIITFSWVAKSILRSCNSGRVDNDTAMSW